MKRFFVLFCIPVATVEAWKASTDPEKMKSVSNEMMLAWSTWMKEHEKMFVEAGAPLAKTKRVTSGGIADARNDMNWYAIMEADSHEAAAKVFEGHPHLQIPDAYIEVVEIGSRGGM